MEMEKKTKKVYYDIAHKLLRETCEDKGMALKLMGYRDKLRDVLMKCMYIHEGEAYCNYKTADCTFMRLQERSLELFDAKKSLLLKQ